MKITNIYNNLILESKIQMGNELEIDGGDAILYHYSDKELPIISNTSGTIKTPISSRGLGVWFYCHKNGISYDKGVSSNYLYIVKIPINEIYDFLNNPDDINIANLFKAKTNIRNMGYSAWFSTIHRTTPVVLGLKGEYKPIKAFKFGNNGYEEIDVTINPDKDVIVGTYKVNPNYGVPIYADKTTAPSENSFYYLDYHKNKIPMTVNMIKQSTPKIGSGAGEYADVFSKIKYNR